MASQALLVAGQNESNVTVWDPATGASMGSYRQSSSLPNCLAALGAGGLAAAQHGARGQPIRFWRRGREGVASTSFAPERLGCLAASPDGALLFGGGASGRGYLWDVSTGALLRSWPAHYRGVSSAGFSDRGWTLFTGGEDGVVHAWLVADVASPAAGGAEGAGPVRLAPAASWSDHALGVSQLVVGAGEPNPLVASVSRDRTAVGRRVGLEGSPTFRVASPCALRAVALDPAERALYVGGDDGNVYQIDLLGGIALVGDGRGGRAPGPSGAPARSHAAAASSASAVAQGSGGAAVLSPPWRGHASAITALALFGSDSELLASGSEDGSVMLWDAGSGQQTLSLPSPVGGGAVSGLLAVGAEARRTGVNRVVGEAGRGAAADRGNAGAGGHASAATGFSAHAYPPLARVPSGGAGRPFEGPRVTLVRGPATAARAAAGGWSALDPLGPEPLGLEDDPLLAYGYEEDAEGWEEGAGGGPKRVKTDGAKGEAEEGRPTGAEAPSFDASPAADLSPDEASALRSENALLKGQLVKALAAAEKVAAANERLRKQAADALAAQAATL